ncbi:glycoside hydrolase family 13 protein [Luteimicrobium xylanilyticum]|uniref:Alpha,alpha-phosphotrehalase n=1 Tax=Luteimicrobium xylanilyticum TaxID=1133546 RepID=A0A5P9Q8D5_9MICO|nr:glycoside hydrolase family 13 protein [Luteimicrobium xylanilyticum]QFU97674.1 Alpha,alpha-phosphotrehalase [Luteimicrobium xylanilyticum]
MVYEIYPRSFAGTTRSGEGDLAGVRARLPYLESLGVDAVWLTPWYPSPMADGGYDVADYRDIDPRFGTLADAETLVADAHARGIRVIVDLVANHTSDRHPWFRTALAAPVGSPERARYHFRDGRGAGGDEPPNDWISGFGQSAWTRVVEPDGRPGQWYLHTFAPQQPDLNWDDPDVVAEFDDVLRFWLDRGVDGVRVDAVPAMAKVPGLPDAGYDPAAGFQSGSWVDVPHWDTDAVHDILRRWRTVGDEYDGDRLFVAEAVVSSPERLARYVRPDELHSAFVFDVVRAGWDAARLREAVDTTLESLGGVGAVPSWMLSSHDETRHVTRLGRAETRPQLMAFDSDLPSDLLLGTRRARAAVMLLLALPGMVCLYQGEELGLPEVTDLPEDALQDPTWERSGRTSRGRDGCRVPLPWSGSRPPYGFAPDGTPTWLPQPAGWEHLTVDAEERDPGSMLRHYRRLLATRRGHAELREGGFAWEPSPAGTLHLVRGRSVHCMVNLGSSEVPLPPGLVRVLASSVPLPDGVLEPDAAIWFTTTVENTPDAPAA